MLRRPFGESKVRVNKVKGCGKRAGSWSSALQVVKNYFLVTDVTIIVYHSHRHTCNLVDFV